MSGPSAAGGYVMEWAIGFLVVYAVVGFNLMNRKIIRLEQQLLKTKAVVLERIDALNPRSEDGDI